MKNLTDYGKQRDATKGQDEWAKLKSFREPVTGKVLRQNPQGDASPVGTGLQ